MKTLQKRIGILCLAALMLACTLFTVSCDSQEDDTTTTASDATTTAPEDDTTTAPQGFEYTVFVVDEVGNAISGVKVQFCSISMNVCFPTRYTDEGDGIIKVTQSKDGDYKVLPVESTIPEGYAVVGADADGYFHFDANRTLTIVLQSE